jgi:AcrR family transcriptional regulator
MIHQRKPKKYKDIYKTGKHLFWKYGMKRVSIEEICRESGVSKMTFYKYFPNKVELAKTILTDLMEASILMVDQLIESDIPFSEKLEKLFLMKLEGSRDLSMEFIKDIYKNPESGLVHHMEELKQKSLAVIVKFYQTAQKQGSIRKDLKIEFILALTNQIAVMIQDEKLVSLYDQPQDFIMESMNVIFYGIVTDNA